MRKIKNIFSILTLVFILSLPIGAFAATYKISSGEGGLYRAVEDVTINGTYISSGNIVKLSENDSYSSANEMKKLSNNEVLNLKRNTK